MQLLVGGSGWQKLPGPTVTSKFDTEGRGGGQQRLTPGLTACGWVGRCECGGLALVPGPIRWFCGCCCCCSRMAGGVVQNCTNDLTASVIASPCTKSNTVWRILFGFQSRAPNIKKVHTPSGAQHTCTLLGPNILAHPDCTTREVHACTAS